MQHIIENQHHIAVTDRIPGILHGILTKRHIHPSFGELLDSRDATTLRERVLTPLQIQIFRRRAGEIDMCGLQQLAQMEEIGIVGRSQGASVACRGLRTDTGAIGECGQQFKIT